MEFSNKKNKNMEFTLKFCPQKGHSVELSAKKLGLKALDNARVIHPEIKAADLKSYITRVSQDKEWELEEKDARLSGRFLDVAEVTVPCPRSFLNDCMLEVLVKDELSKGWEYRFQLDKGKAFKKWKKLGFPLEIEEES